MPTTGIDNELRRLQAGLRALGERLEQEREAGLMSDTELTRLAKAVDAVAYQVEAMNKEKLPAIKAGIDRINGRVERHAEVIAAHDKSISLLQQFCTDQVKPMLVTAQENKINLAKWGVFFAGGGLGLFGIIELIIKAASG